MIPKRIINSLGRTYRQVFRCGMGRLCPRQLGLPGLRQDGDHGLYSREDQEAVE